MTLITLKNVSVRYGATEALSNVDMEIYPNDFLGIIGPNGGGKTSLVKAMLKTIAYSGEVIYSPEIESNNRRSIGYLPQNSNIDRSFPISVQEVVLSGLQSERKLFGRYSASDRAKALEVMKTCGIESLSDRPVGELSGGQLQRTMLGRALITNPKLLILDEPTNFVDNKFEKELYEILKRLHEKMAIVMVSHDLGTIASYVKSIVCVNKHVHRHDSNKITAEQLRNYNCPIQVIYHGDVPHTVLEKH